MPDRENRSSPAIDLLGHDDLGVICLEHTVVEAYDGQILDNRRAAALRGLLDERFLDGLTPPGMYTLTLVTGSLTGSRERDIASMASAIEGWTREQQVPEPGEWPTKARVAWVESGPPGVPVVVKLYRAGCATEDNGKLRIAFERDPSIDQQRSLRIQKALADKLPKLDATRPDGAHTVLVLEHWDFVLSNPWQEARLLYRVAQTMKVPLSDSIVIIDTSAGEGAWSDYLVRYDGFWSNAVTDEPHVLNVPGDSLTGDPQEGE